MDSCRRDLTHARISASNAETFGSLDEPGFIFDESLEIDCSPSRILLAKEEDAWVRPVFDLTIYIVQKEVCIP